MNGETTKGIATANNAKSSNAKRPKISVNSTRDSALEYNNPPKETPKIEV